jgi:hypothetical protein
MKTNYEITSKRDLGETHMTQITVDNQYNTFWLNGLNVCGI